jgi:ribosomal protein S18 acetylase RimI-like enzyme
VTDPTFSLRPVGSSDEALLLRIFTESHCDGFAQLGLDPGALASLIRMQFQARQAQYRVYPGGAEYLVWRDEVVVGNCWLSDTAEQLRVLDIAVLAEHRRRGVARAVLGQVCARAAAAGKPVRLSVWHQNTAALELYRVFGFIPGPTANESEPGQLGNGYLELQYCPEVAKRQAGAR